MTITTSTVVRFPNRSWTVGKRRPPEVVLDAVYYSRKSPQAKFLSATSPCGSYNVRTHTKRSVSAARTSASLGVNALVAAGVRLGRAVRPAGRKAADISHDSIGFVRQGERLRADGFVEGAPPHKASINTDHPTLTGDEIGI